MKKITNKTWDYSTGVPGMVRHTRNGYYYSRFQLNGKRTMKALGTKVSSVAKQKHFRVLADNEKARSTTVVLVKGNGRMGEIIAEALQTYCADTSIKANSKVCFSSSVDRLFRYWPLCFSTDLRTLKPERITNEQVEEFSNYLHTKAEWRRHKSTKTNRGYGPATVNKTLQGLLRILKFAKYRNYISEVPFTLKKQLGGKSIEKRTPTKKINFPTQDRINEVFAQLRTVHATPTDQPELLAYLQSRAHESGDYAEFMAYTGARRNEAAFWKWEDEREDAVIIRGTKTDGSMNRIVPKIAALADLLRRMKARRAKQSRKLSGRAFMISECRVALATACELAGVERWTHHSLRHLFATKCIESGVDIPTVSRWMGHSDGGALAMKTYGHLRQEHSQTQAAKVSFGTSEVQRG
jgi:integrase|uniref:tyrosine-type recombinase/integrase n=1 Tax=Cephaloticoccus sp. TaxID=1985742 RepID=UPI00404B1F43